MIKVLRFKTKIFKKFIMYKTLTRSCRSLVILWHFLEYNSSLCTFLCTHIFPSFSSEAALYVSNIRSSFCQCNNKIFLNKKILYTKSSSLKLWSDFLLLWFLIFFASYGFCYSCSINYFWSPLSLKWFFIFLIVKF